MTEKVEIGNATLYRGDCMEVMKQVPVRSIDGVLTDPPYNIARENNFHTMGRAGIDFGEWDKNADLFSYIAEANRVLKNGGSLVVFNDWKNLGDISKEAERTGLETKDLLRLEKTNPMPRNRDRRYITDFELAVWFVKPGAKWVFNRMDEKYQRPKFLCPIDKGSHPTQKSLKLMQELVLIHSNVNQTILDPFMGSGTTGVACKSIERKFIGIEKERKYFDIACERIETAQKQGHLFGVTP